VALAASNSRLADLFQHRFAGGDGLEGHAVGNLILAALYQKTGSMVQAIEIAGHLLPTRGRALAATETPSTLCAAFQDGSTVRGESHITAAGRLIERVWLEPDSPPAGPGVLEAIRSADAVVLAPGSLYTSLIPNLLVAGVADAIRRSSAVKIMVCNLMTQRGETDGFSASDHLRAVQVCLGRGAVGFCVVNSALAQSGFGNGGAAGAQPVHCDLEQIRSLEAVPIEADLWMQHGERIRHNPAALARLVVALARVNARPNSAFDQFKDSQGMVSACLN
jgi:uncharacterized cofD-like protein